MRYVVSRSWLFGAAMVMVAVGGAAVGAQAPQSGAPGTAGAQTPANVNVVNVPTVTVGNTALQPIPVKAPAKEPVHLNVGGTFTPGIGQITLGTYPVPAGKRLVVEHFSMSCRSDSANDVRAELMVNDVTLTFLPLTTVPFTAFPGSVTGSAAVPVSAYIDEGTLAVRAARTSGTNNTLCLAAVLGYLTPLQ